MKAVRIVTAAGFRDSKVIKEGPESVSSLVIKKTEGNREHRI